MRVFNSFGKNECEQVTRYQRVILDKVLLQNEPADDSDRVLRGSHQYDKIFTSDWCCSAEAPDEMTCTASQGTCLAQRLTLEDFPAMARTPMDSYGHGDQIDSHGQQMPAYMKKNLKHRACNGFLALMIHR